MGERPVRLGHPVGIFAALDGDADVGGVHQLCGEATSHTGASQRDPSSTHLFLP